MRKRKNRPAVKNNTTLVSLVGLAFFSIVLIFFPGQNRYLSLRLSDIPREPEIILPSPAPYPVNITGSQPEELTAQGVVITDFASGETLFARNENKHMAPASTTKMMTALVAIENYDLDTVLAVKTVITEGSAMGLVVGEKITVEHLLYGALIHSGNDAAYTLAENFPGGIEAFVHAMNQKAEQLHLTNTHFTNPIGFDDSNHYTTPKELLRLARAVVGHKELTKIVAIPEITVSDVSYTHFHKLQNVNELVGKIPGVSGLKTGFTENAGESVVSMVERDGHKILIVVLNSEDRFKETKELINWVFGNFEWKKISPDF